MWSPTETESVDDRLGKALESKAASSALVRNGRYSVGDIEGRTTILFKTIR